MKINWKNKQIARLSVKSKNLRTFLFESGSLTRLIQEKCMGRFDINLINGLNDININVFDVNGQLVDVIYSGFLSLGHHQFIWRPINISSGIYFVSLETE